MDWNQAKDVILLAMTSVFIGYVGRQLSKVVDSIEKLNIKIAEIIVHIDNHAKRITKLEEDK